MADTLNLSKEIIFSSSDSNVSRKISSAEKAGKLKKLAPRIYTTNSCHQLKILPLGVKFFIDGSDN